MFGIEYEFLSLTGYLYNIKTLFMLMAVSKKFDFFFYIRCFFGFPSSFQKRDYNCNIDCSARFLQDPARQCINLEGFLQACMIRTKNTREQSISPLSRI